MCCQSAHANRSSHQAWSALIWDPKVFAIDNVYQSRNIHLPSSVHMPDDSSLHACRGPRINLWGICLISGLQFYVCLYENGGQLSMETHLSLSFLPLPHPFISFCCLFSSSLFSSPLLSPPCILLFQSSDLEDSIKQLKMDNSTVSTT